jgi:hypothetical protein
MDPEQEKAAELEATKQVTEEEVRAKVIEEFGFDEVDDAERIDKLVAKEVEHSKKLSSAIGQKINYRTKFEEASKNPPAPKSEVAKVAPEDVSKVVAQTLEQRDLDDMEYPDTIKAEIKRIAAITNKSVKHAARDPYIVSTFIEPWQKEQRADEASISRTNRSSGKKPYTMDNPPDVDMSTEEGRKEWDAYKAALIKSGN